MTDLQTQLLLVALVLALGVAVGWLLRTGQVARLRAERDVAVTRSRELADDRESMKLQFQALSSDALTQQRQQNEASASLRRDETQQLLQPVAEALTQLSHRLTEVEKQRAAMSAELREQVRGVTTSSEQLRRETASLATALRKPQVRGAWGEVQLRRIAEIAGMVERCDFDTQASFGSGAGALRPDMQVNLANGHKVFVDAKVPLAAFLAAAEETGTEASQHLADFGKHVRNHVDALGGKQYYQLADSPEFVVLFLPSDAFLAAALEHIPDLHEYAAKHNVVVATPAILIALLRTVAHSWQQTELAESAQDIVASARELYDRLGVLGAHFDKLGRSLTTSVKAYNEAVGSLERRVLPTARRLQSMRTDELPSPTEVTESPRPVLAAEVERD